jgi:UDP-N-acetylmuramoyl-tripeptide--D-alanyl-D-alanine ligase
VKRITIEYKDLQSLSDVELLNVPASIDITKVSTDTRSIKKGSLFVALGGESFDGHNFIAEAVKKGASAIVVSKKKLPSVKVRKTPVIAVENTMLALGELANCWRKKFTGKVIAITGSNGKTTTKETLAVILRERYKVVATSKNNNNQIGVPLTIFQVTNEDDYLILEMGTNHPGEIEYLAEVAQPDLALITNIGASHLEFLGSVKGVRREKTSLFKVTDKCGGTVFINIDDKELKPLTKEYKKAVLFGSKNSADVVGKLKGYNKSGYPIVSIDGEKIFEVALPVYGKTNVLNVLAASAVALHEGVSKQEIVHGIRAMANPKQRLEPKEFPNGLLLDDTYNANPESMLAAFDALRNIKEYKNKWLVLGDMFELGENGPKLHKNLAAQLMKIPDIRVFTVGELMYNLFKELKKYYVPVWHAHDRATLKANIAETDFSNSVVLVKGSRGMKMEEFVQQILEKY